jgi:ABC-type dipeptide/oligopeptide/nickel transport system permease component
MWLYRCMFEKLRKRIVFTLGVALFLGMIWAIREYGIWDLLESLFSDPGQVVPEFTIGG